LTITARVPGEAAAINRFTHKGDGMTTTASTFDLGRLAEAIEARDAARQIELYAPDATVTISDRLSQPGAPRVIHGREAIATWIKDSCAREMTHSVNSRVQDDGGAAFVVACRYGDGTNVVCATVLELAGGLIAKQTIVQAWDER
jgi:SnoaL-like domain